MSLPASNYLQKTNKIELSLSQKVLVLQKVAPRLKPRVLKMALSAYKTVKNRGMVKNNRLTIIDYSLPSSKKRMWVFDLEKGTLLYALNVAHGKNSGGVVPHRFSNREESHQTSLGTFLTKSTYMGLNGYSLNIEGLEKGINDKAYKRRVVIHGARYMEADFIKRKGRAGKSLGCPSIASSVAKPVINAIKGGSVIFAYYPDKHFLKHSNFIAPPKKKRPYLFWPSVQSLIYRAIERLFAGSYA